MMRVETRDVSCVIKNVKRWLECLGQYRIDARVHVCSCVDHDENTISLNYVAMISYRWAISRLDQGIFGS